MVHRVESWPDLVKRVTNPMTQTQIAERAGVAQTNVGRWLRGERGQPQADTVVRFCRAFKVPPLEGLMAAGFITAEEAHAATRVRVPLAEYSTEELLDEIRRRTIHDR